MLTKDQERDYKQKLMNLAQSKKFVEAEQLAIQLTDHLPKDMEIWFTLGKIFLVQKKLDKAVFAFHQASSKKSPFQTEALDSYIQLCQYLARYKEGYEACKKSLRLKSSSASANYQLGYFAWQLNYETEAVTYLEKGLKLDPSNAAYHLSWAEALTYIGEIDDALVYFESSKKHSPENDLPHIRSLFVSNYSSHLSDESIYDAHRQFAERLESRYPNPRAFDKDQKNQRIRIAYLSKDFRHHAVAFFFLPILQAHDSTQFEIYCYSDSSKFDDMSAQIQSTCEHWVDVYKLNQTDLYNKIRDDKIDILIDLVGYAGNSRMEVFAMRAAPIQISYLGYANTTGLSRMDYRITDECCDPIENEGAYHSEKLLRLKNGFLCYMPLVDAPSVSELPSKINKKITFGSFNMYPKLNEGLFQAWAKILCAVDNSKLFIKAKLFADKKNRGAFIKKMAQYGVKSNQFIFAGRVPTINDHLKEFSKVDIHLDSFPYNGTTTTCDALWMGVPSITLAGTSHRSRVGMSIMGQMNLSDFVAHNYDDYVDIAIEKSKDIKALALLRSSIRDRFQSSTLMDKERLAAELEMQYLSLKV